MSLYSVDIIPDQHGKLWIAEVSGATSGMRGFTLVYGDTRVEDRVYQMLEDRYGTLTVDDGNFMLLKRLNESHSATHKAQEIFRKVPFLKRLFEERQSLLDTPSAITDWMKEDVPNNHNLDFPFEPYDGQESTIINQGNNILPHPTINSYVTEEIARNKFLQYLLLTRSRLKKKIIPSALVGMGATDEKMLERLVEENDRLLIKPICGIQGRGIKVFPSEQADSFACARGPIFESDVASFFYSIIKKERQETDLIYLEDMIDAKDWSFEPGLSVIQPFIEQAVDKDDPKYVSIRAIVCNEKFVDAYARVSSNPVVNLSRDATAEEVEDKDRIAKFAEHVVKYFTANCLNFKPDNFRQRLYGRHLEKVGRTTPEMRHRDATFNTFFALTAFLRDGLPKPL